MISIASYSFHGLIGAGQMDVFGYLETCKYRYHLQTADIWNGLLGRDEKVYLQDPFLKLVKSALDERELILVNYHADGCHPWEPDAAARDAHHQSALAHLHAATLLGAKTMRIDAGGKDKTWTNEQFDHIVRRYREYCRIGADHGFKVGPESHWGTELVPDNMERLCRAVDHPAFGILMHIGRWDGAPEEEGDRRLAPWTVHTHVDARVAQTRFDSAYKILRDAGYKGAWGVEHHTGANEYAEVAVQIAQVERVLHKV